MRRTPPAITPPYLTIEEAAARRGCSAATIWRRAQRGELTLQRVLGRTVVTADQVDRLEMPAGGGRWRRPQTLTPSRSTRRTSRSLT